MVCRSETELSLRYVGFQAPVASLSGQVPQAVGSMVSRHRSDFCGLAVWVQEWSTMRSRRRHKGTRQLGREET